MKLTLLQIVIRLLLSIAVGVVIGGERSRHGRAAGMRTHVLVCLGACLTSMIGVYGVSMGFSGDMYRIPAQVISGIGFLGAGMIILKNNNMITGLTTAAGVWTTGVIGIALGYGFYFGALIVAVLFMASLIIFAKFEKRKKSTEVIFVEIDDSHFVNEVIDKIKESYKMEISFQILPPKSNNQSSVGLNIVIDRVKNFDFEALRNIEHIAYAVEEN